MQMNIMPIAKCKINAYICLAVCEGCDFQV